MLARGIKDGIVKNCAGGDLAGGKAAHDIADLVGRAQMGGTVIATGDPAGHLLHGAARLARTSFLHGTSRLNPSRAPSPTCGTPSPLPRLPARAHDHHRSPHSSPL